MLYRLLILALISACLPADTIPVSPWGVARSKHFEVYSQQGTATARAALIWFEQLLTFFSQQTSLKPNDQTLVRVIGFRSAKEYAPYRLRPTSDAYYAGIGDRDFIVMPDLNPGAFGVAAHEYAHLVLHANGQTLPPWLNEGIAELFATLRIHGRDSEFGGDLPSRTSALKQHSLLSLDQLFGLTAASPLLAEPAGSSLFYAQSWALTEMLALSSDYGPQFAAFVEQIHAGAPSAQALDRIYHKSTQAALSDLNAWLNRRTLKPVSLPPVATGQIAIEVSEASASTAQLQIAEILLALGNVGRAEALFRALPDSGDASVGLGAISLINRDYESARHHWQHALAQEPADAALCFRYAELAQTSGFSSDEIRSVLERALAIQPHFDDARYSLALLENNMGRFEEGVKNLRAVQYVPPVRAFAYWTALAYALTELDRREEAEAAARTASEHAANATERAHADELAYMARTDPAVRFSTDTNGSTRLVTTRIPHNTKNWNPFIEPNDDMRRVQGTLRQINCNGSVTSIQVDSESGPLLLSIPDALHVQMRNAPQQFLCGKQSSTSVIVDYAVSAGNRSESAGIVRGMEFQ